ncbi:MAG TPA: dienelactone hydrolase family protein [Bacteroidales bacterium]|nr:dienelactone hydrolase family protein [Bacteroidales bacterium]
MTEFKLIEKGRALKEAKKAIIILHGRGGTANNIITLGDEFCDERFYIVAPQAPGNSWYPNSFLVPAGQNEPWLSQSVEFVKHLISKAADSVGNENVYIMGFSQGACLAYEVTARNAGIYGGIIGFSGGLIGETVNTSNYKGDFKKTKVFIGSSDVDPHIPLERSIITKEIMEGLGAEVLFHIYKNMPHTITDEEIETVRREFF